MTKARTKLLLYQPFFGSIALGLRLIESTDLSTMATDGKSIQYNPNFVNEIGLDLTVGVIAHEVMHVVMKHHLRRGHRDPDKWNMAADYAINDVLLNSGVRLPEDRLYDEKYKNWSTERIYEDLPDNTEGEGQDWGFVIDMSGEDGKPLSPAETEAINDLLDAKIFEAAQVAKSAGSLPMSIEALVDKMRKPQVYWPDYIRRALGGEIPDDYTWKTLNRKWFTGYNIYMPGTLKYGAGHVVAIIDTSASVYVKEQEQFLGELSSICADIGAESITVIGCDAAVQTVETYAAGEKINTLNTTGGGGTRAKPAFDYLDEYGYTPNAVIYFTDGGICDLDTIKPPPYEVIWASTGEIHPHFGEVIPIKILEEAA
jgi:predicted metal-dependent peptidase